MRRDLTGEKMRKIRVSVLLAVFLVLLPLALFSCAADKREEKVVFIDLEAVISEEKKRIFSRVLRGELSREEAEERVGRFFHPFRGGSCRLRAGRLPRA